MLERTRVPEVFAVQSEDMVPQSLTGHALALTSRFQVRFLNPTPKGDAWSQRRALLLHFGIVQTAERLALDQEVGGSTPSPEAPSSTNPFG